MAQGDKYAGLVTALAVLIAIFYSAETFDGWDIYLGAFGLILGWKYRKSAQRSDVFFTILVASMLALSAVAVASGIIQLCIPAAKQLICKTPFRSSLVSVITLSVVATVVLLCRARRTESQLSDAGD